MQMHKCAPDKPLLGTQKASTHGCLDIGVFAPTNVQLPTACMVHCLEGDANKALTHGCAMIKSLLNRREEENNGNIIDDHRCKTDSSKPMPKVCGQGYAVALAESSEPGNPDVLILHPPRHSDQVENIIDSAISCLQSSAAKIWRLHQENDGLASEVLRSYEQINLIFDVSAQIAILSNADEVLRMLLIKLKHMFEADEVFFVSADERTVTKVSRNGQVTRMWGNGLITNKLESPESKKPDSSGSLKLEPDDQDLGDLFESIELPPEFVRARDRLRESHRVFVAASDPDYEQTGHGTSLWGPLNEGDEGSAIIGIVRRNAPFVAGDMLLLDSVLTFSGHILSNLRLVDKLKRTSFEAVRALVAAIDQKDNYTFGHSERVGFLARATGELMGLPAQQLQVLEFAGLLHDVGKIGIPESVLNKPGKLTEEEYALIKEHPSRSYEVLRPVASLEPVLEAVLYHHENIDGSGYPAGLKGEDIPLSARIIHIVDVFDALTSTRSYRKAYDVERAMNIIRNDAGLKLDPEITEYFMNAWSRLPATHPEQYERWFGTWKEAVI